MTLGKLYSALKNSPPFSLSKLVLSAVATLSFSNAAFCTLAYGQDINNNQRDIASLILASDASTSQITSPSPYNAIQDNIVIDYSNPLKVISDEDINLYREIFSLQKDGNWNSAKKKIAQVQDPILMGYVDFQRLMHPTKYRSSYSELKKWMAYHADHPDAKEIYQLALRRRPKSASNPIRPEKRQWRVAQNSSLHPLLEQDYNAKRKSRVRQIEGRVRYLINKSQAAKAFQYINANAQKRDITTRQYDRMKSWIAASFYYQGYVAKAKNMASAVADRNGDTAVLAYWIDGLIAFREGNNQKAYERFQAMANVDYQEDSLRSGAAFWAARTGLASGNTDDMLTNLDLAARYPFTFYGQLAMAQIGRTYDYNWSDPSVTVEGFASLSRTTPRVRRAAALALVGKKKEADLELRWANGEIEAHEDYDLIAMAAALDLPAAQIDIALLGQGKYRQAALYPIPEYEPQKGFKTDRALLYALMRQESKFKTEATSRVGARGLMQLMPRTASFIGRDRSLHQASGRNRLYDPAFNMELGQKYVNHLLDTAAKGNLFHMAVAYNGGPGNLRRWKREMNIEDSLLFIESIPNTESRNFVENVLTNFWVYRARLAQPAPSRDRVAAGELPLFEAVDQLTGNFRND